MDASRNTLQLLLRSDMRMLKRVVCGLLAGIAAALLVATSASAQDPGAPAPSPAPAATPAAVSWRGFYAGGGGIYSNVGVDVGNGGCHEDCYWGD